MLLADAPSKGAVAKAVRTEGKRRRLSVFVLPFNPSDIQPNARVFS